MSIKRAQWTTVIKFAVNTDNRHAKENGALIEFLTVDLE